MTFLFKLRGELTSTQRLVLEIAGFAFLILIWAALTAGANPIVSAGILPKPLDVLYSFGDLYRDNEIIKNVCRSLGLNIAGYLEAILISIPVGFLIGLLPIFRGSLQRQIDAFRYVPLTAVTGLFIIWFGLGSSMKIHFLAFGILIYLLPIIVQRIDEVDDVYLTTVYTLGANAWQTIRSVYIPSVISRLSDDIRVLTAISWTYIIVAEGLGNQGGIGSLIWIAGQRQGRVDKVFALLLIIIIIGFVQDRIFLALDKEFFPHKYQIADSQKKGKQKSAASMLWQFASNLLIWVFLGIYAILLINEFAPILTDNKILSNLFGDTTWVIHLLVLATIAYKLYSLLTKKK